MGTNIFDVRAGMDRHNIAVLDPQVVAHNSVETRAALVKLIVREDDKDRVLPLLAADQDGIAAEELQRVHGSGREDDGRVVILDGIGDPASGQCFPLPRTAGIPRTSAG